MSRLPNLGSLRSIANYGEDEVESDEEAQVTRKKMKVDSEEEHKEKSEGSDFDIVVSDEDDDNSRAGSVIIQPRVNIASRLVSYGEDEDDETAKLKDVEVNEIPFASLPENLSSTTKEDIASPEEKVPTPTPSEETKIETTDPEKDMDEENIPEKLREHLAAVKAISVTLPDQPDGRCSNSLQEKIEKLLETKQRTGRDLKSTIQRKKNFRNPSIYEKLVSFCSINEIGTNYPPNIYDPFSWTEESFYENLSKLQRENHEKKQRERSKVEFVTATKKTVADEAAKKRKSKWDVTSTGTAAPIAKPVPNIQSIAAVKTVAAAKAKIINTVANVQAKKP